METVRTMQNMQRVGRWRWLGLVAVVWSCGGRLDADETALDRYVNKPDPSFSWKVVESVPGPSSETIFVELTSQTWRTSAEVDRPVWKHWLLIVKPNKVTSKTAFLFIGGGGNDRPMPKGADEHVLMIAQATNSVVAELRTIPNQPLVFHNDGQPRKEDDLIGYTLDQFLKTGDETWPARLPMVKSVVRAMDCVQQVMGSEERGKLPIEKFVLAGGSKRGWTTWCAAAVDKRVAAAIPIVIDVLNVERSMRHHVGVYGFYAAAVGNYHQHRIFQRTGDPRLKELNGFEDPLSYRERLTMPKFIINSAQDQFFLPDSSQFYFDQLVGEKHLRYVPNADHSLRGSDVPQSMIAFYEMLLMDKPRPEFTWSFEKDGSIRVVSRTRPSRVNLWQATNPEARDFRLLKIGPAFKSRPLEDQGGGVYVAKVDPPGKGFTAFFAELVFDAGVSFPLKLTTSVRIVPDTLPFADLDPKLAPLESVPEASASGQDQGRR